jgi:DNA-binding transcriptional LysR family regulator
LGYDRDDSILRSSAQLGAPLKREDFCFRTDDVSVYWEALRQGMGIGFVSESLAHTDGEVVRVLPSIKLPVLPVWLAVHREVRTDRRIRSVYDFLARTIPQVL